MLVKRVRVNGKFEMCGNECDMHEEKCETVKNGILLDEDGKDFIYSPLTIYIQWCYTCIC